MPPFLVAGTLGVVAAVLSAGLLTRYRLSHHFYNPPLLFVALMVIYTVLFGTFVVRG